ncbi:arylsulfatase [Pseudomonas sp. NBRC 100443]|uniref:arylsulfatase n=1 Tax=Pseudomonas sp. NBRC 100443 TaxID=1113665 RepID=UPI0024A208C4|nr:arylsulfatase [Pseudomonas sp. NBRC 100443]GLU37327.1 arylsulfatase [Pseudomonas sp. NBRC 100443]
MELSKLDRAACLRTELITWIALALAMLLCSGAYAATGSSARPNIILIVADDLGYSDLGTFGGEISTPNIDALAASGVRLTNFHASPTCSPSRSMLLTGTDNHTAGVGAMAEILPEAARRRWGYEGRLTGRVATIAERLKAAGYSTYMVGKWHLGREPGSIPSARGFDHSFALLQGAHNHFGQGGFGPDSSPELSATYLTDGKATTVPADFYSTDYFTDQIIQRIDQRNDTAPFFAYLAYTAPHSPLQAPDDIRDKYAGHYDQGWSAIYQQRLKQMQAQGVLPDNAQIPTSGLQSQWNALPENERKIEARKMEIYAAMVDRLDANVGRLNDYLKRKGLADNTVIILLSDNGPAGETANTFRIIPGVAEYIESHDNSLAAMGTAKSFLFYGKQWAQVASGPYAGTKGAVSEGGVRVPAIIHAPWLASPGISRSYATIMDITPTLLDIAHVDSDTRIAGNQVAPIKGLSLLPLFSNPMQTIHDDSSSYTYELHGQRSITQGGRWKLSWVPKLAGGSGEWALYDLEQDPYERSDLSKTNLAKFKQLENAWNEYAKAVKL